MRSNHPIFFPKLLLIVLLSGILFASCAPTKYVPEGSFLLNKVEIKTDAGEVNKSDLKEYVRQNPNSYILGIFRLQLGIYNLSEKDSTKWIDTKFRKWVNRTLRKLGQAPVVLDTMLTDISAQQLLNYHVNKGYYDAEINPEIKTKNKKAAVIYRIKSNKPYKINDYQVDVPFQDLSDIAKDSTRSLIRKDMLFDVYQLDEERGRITSRMRRGGYYNFSKDHLSYTADSINHNVNVRLELRDYLKAKKDTLNSTIFRQFGVSRVVFNLIPSASSLVRNSKLNVNDTVFYGNYTLIGPADKFLTLKSLIESTFVTPGNVYSDQDVERTYSALNSLPPVKYTDISFSETAPDSLQCYITIAEAKSLTLSTQAEVTFTEGYWGTAGNLGLVNRNLFKGAESLTVQGRLALEKQDDVMAQEWGAQVGVRVPRTIIPFLDDSYSRSLNGATEFRTTFNYQNRPGEFSSINAGGGIKYSWITGRQNHNLDLLDVSYIHFPSISTAFRDSFITTGKYNKYNYYDYLIMRINYSASFNGFNANRPMRNYLTYRYGIESAGNLLYALDELFNFQNSQEDAHKIFGVRYSQYIRGEFNTTYHQILDKNNKFVYHAGVGVGYPYGNADIIPFERRFYSGGANSVRGWSESALGPGTYERFSSSRRRDYNQVGDIKLDMNFEYRSKMFWVLEGALFLDAGNVWTIRDYENQPGGLFLLESFWKQIALAYGIGFRMDFNFVLLRADIGVKLFDPAATSGSNWKTPPSVKDVAFHIAIGYPF
jgi:outer membrane protein assembly factor BamA